MLATYSYGQLLGRVARLKKLYKIRAWLSAWEATEYLASLTEVNLEAKMLLDLVHEDTLQCYIKLNTQRLERAGKVDEANRFPLVIEPQELYGLCKEHVFSSFECNESDRVFRCHFFFTPHRTKSGNPVFNCFNVELRGELDFYPKKVHWTALGSSFEREPEEVFFIPSDIEALATKMNGGIGLCDYQKEIEALKAEVESLKIEKNSLEESPTVNDEINPRKEETLYKLVIGMAQRGYGYNPDAKKNDAIGEIQRDLDELGLGLGERTIRNHLNAAKAFLPAKPIKT